MKKIALLSVPLLAAISFSVFAAGNHVTYPGFSDDFTVTVANGISSSIEYLGQTGTIYQNKNKPFGCNLTQARTCQFSITDDNTWGSNGTVSFLIGDISKVGPYCKVIISDGALLPEATMSASCMNGAQATELLHNDHAYQFNINNMSASKKG